VRDILNIFGDGVTSSSSSSSSLLLWGGKFGFRVSINFGVGGRRGVKGGD
jgi:hypothetical protein